MAVFTRMLVSSPALARSYRVLHLDTSDRRSLDNMGRLDARNVALALRHAQALDALLRRERPQVVYIELSQNTLAFLRDAVLVLVARLHGCAVAAHLHGSDFQAFYRRPSLPVRGLVRRTTTSLAAAAVQNRAMYNIDSDFAGVSIGRTAQKVVANGRARGSP